MPDAKEIRSHHYNPAIQKQKTEFLSITSIMAKEIRSHHYNPESIAGIRHH